MTKQVIIIKLDGLFYGIDVSLVQEVLYSFGERPLPEAPNFIQGLVYVRERLLPILRTKRLFNSPFFDLHNNKKVLILKFSDTNQIGMIIDEVVGIEVYEPSEMKEVSSVYNVATSQDILGFIEKKGREVVLLNITSFFFTKNGEFRYKRYVNKQQTIVKEVSKADYDKLEKMVEVSKFPFNSLTAKPIIRFITRFASLENKPVDEILSNYPNLFKNNKHMLINQKREYLFENMADMYLLTEYFEKFVSMPENKKINILIVGQNDPYDAMSMALILYTLRRQIDVSITLLIDEKSDMDIKNFSLVPLEGLQKISSELHKQYFLEEEGGYQLLPRISSSISIKKTGLLGLQEAQAEFDLIYSNNYLVTKETKEVQATLIILESLLLKNGVLVLGLFEDVEELVRGLKKYYIKSRLVFLKE